MRHLSQELAPRLARNRTSASKKSRLGRGGGQVSGQASGKSSATLAWSLGEPLAGLGADPVAEDGAVGVVGLVLQAAGQQPVALERRPVRRPGRRPRRARSRGGRTRRRRPGTTGSPRRRRRGGGPCPRAASAVGLQTTPDAPLAVARRGSRRRRPPGPRRSGRRPGRRPSAAYIVATMSATSARSSSSNAVTGACGRCITGVPQRVIGRTVPPSGSGPYGAWTSAGASEDMRGSLGGGPGRSMGTATSHTSARKN